MADPLDDLWCEVLWRATVGISARACLIRLEALLRKPEVRDLYVPFVVEQHVLRLQVPVDDSILVEAAEGLDELCCVEACAPLAKFLVLPQMVEQFTAVQKVHHEVELGRCLESVVQLHDEWTVDLFEDVSLG